MSGGHTPGPLRAAMNNLQSKGFEVREVWIGDYFDGVNAVKRVGPHNVEIYSGNADDGEYSDLHYAPGVYLDGRLIAGNMPSVEKAFRVADFRVTLLRAAIAKAAGAAS